MRRRCRRRPGKLADKEAGPAEVQMAHGTDGHSSNSAPGASNSHAGSGLGPLGAASCFGGCAACLHAYHTHRQPHPHTLPRTHFPVPVGPHNVGMVPEHSLLEANHRALQMVPVNDGFEHRSLHIATSYAAQNGHVDSGPFLQHVPSGHGNMSMEQRDQIRVRSKVGSDGLEDVLPELSSPPGGSGVIPTRPLAQALRPITGGADRGISRAQTWSSSQWVEPLPLGNRLRTPFASPSLQQRLSRLSRLPIGLTPCDASMYGLAEGSPTGDEHGSMVRA